MVPGDGLVGLDPVSIDAAIERALAEPSLQGFHSEAPPDKRGLSPALLAAVLGAHLLNAATTDYALGSARSRGLEAVEANPLLRPFSQSDAALYGSRAVTGLGTAIGSDMLARHGHRRAGKALAVSGALLPILAAAVDFRSTRSHRRTP